MLDPAALVPLLVVIACGLLLGTAAALGAAAGVRVTIDPAEVPVAQGAWELVGMSGRSAGAAAVIDCPPVSFTMSAHQVSRSPSCTPAGQVGEKLAALEEPDAWAT